MKEILLQLAGYRKWANKLLLEKLDEVAPDVLEKNTGSSFGNINNTILHLANSQILWWQRTQLKEKIELMPEDMAAAKNETFKEILRISDLWIELIKNASDTKLEHVIEYRNSKKEAFKQPLFEILLHVFNHQTYHHGQIITMLREQGVEKLPSTDFSLFARKKGRT